MSRSQSSFFLLPVGSLRLALALLAVSSVLALADDVLTVDFPITAPSQSLPERLAEAPRQVTTPDGTGYAEFSLLPIPEDRELVVTLIFKEDGTAGPALFWISESSTRQVNIAGDLAEGVRGFNQRTILIPREVSSQQGKLIVQGKQSNLRRVRMDWVPQRRVLAAPDQRPVAFISSDRFLQDTELAGEKTLSPPDIWFGKVLEASLQEEPESLAENLEFAVTLDQPVAQAMFVVKMLGLALDKSVEVWVNGTSVGKLQPGLPSLTDAGYLKDESGRMIYAGWRGGALYLPAKLLQTGDNAIVIAAPGGEVFLRDAALQLRASADEKPAPAAEIVTGQPGTTKDILIQ